jgi:hypothetical protein
MRKLIRNIQYIINKIRYPENVWYGGSLKKENALHCVGKGWSKLINNLYDAKPKDVKIWQVKEKWGTLHFYTSGAPKWYDDLIDYYGHESGRICEQCGNPGKLRTDRYWIVTLCDECDKIDRDSRNIIT